MRSSQTVDMTRGSITRLLIRFAIPMLIGNLFQQAYNLGDSMIVGQFLGSDALAAVGATGSVSFLFSPSATASAPAAAWCRPELRFR